jgi:hypothetical protein
MKIITWKQNGNSCNFWQLIKFDIDDFDFLLRNKLFRHKLFYVLMQIQLVFSNKKWF